MFKPIKQKELKSALRKAAKIVSQKPNKTALRIEKCLQLLSTVAIVEEKAPEPKVS